MSTYHYSGNRRTNVADAIDDDELRERIAELRRYDRLSQAQSADLRDYEHHLAERERARNEDRLARALGMSPAEFARAREAGETVRVPAGGINPGAAERARDHAVDPPPVAPTPAGTRDQARRVIEEAHRRDGLADHAAERATALLDQGSPSDRSLAARWAAAAGASAYRTAFGKMMQDPTRGHLLWTPEEAAAYRVAAAVAVEMRALGLTTGSGSAMVPLTLDPAINLTSAGSINPLREISRVVQTVSNTWQGVTSAGATAEWKAEHAEAADGSPTLASPSIPVHLGDVDVPHSYEVAMDAMDFLDQLRVVLLDAAGLLMATAYTTGTGTGQPTGVITTLAAGQTVNSAGTDVFAKADVYNLQNALPPRFQGNARWCAALPTLNTMSQFETTAGARLFPELSEGRLLNRPIHELSDMDGVINATQDNFILLYGDFQQFVIVDRVGATLEILPGYGANRRPTAERHAFLTFRTGSDAVVDNAFRRLNVT